MYECIIFDVDGTLVNTEKAVIGSLQRMLKVEYNKELQEDELFFTFGIPGEKALQQLGISDINKAMEKWGMHLQDFLKHIKVYNGIEEVVKKLDEIGIKTGIVTSRNNEEIENDLVLSKIIHYFPCIISADDTLKHKPEPEPLLKFLEITETDPSKAIYIGDTIYDFKCADDAGIDFGLALWGAKGSEKIEGKYKFNDPNEILDILSSPEII